MTAASLHKKGLRGDNRAASERKLGRAVRSPESESDDMTDPTGASGELRSRLGTLERLDARNIWKSEAYEFTPWLRDNIGLLGQALGIEIDVDVQREVAVGLFSADLLGTDVATNATILIENQLEQTDHGHLGQLLTYAGGLGADILIWVATKIREEHRQALTWLNERTPEEVLFFGVEVELLRVDGSKPAAHFNVVAAPNEWQKARPHRLARRASSGISEERAERYKAFWRGLLERILQLDPTATTASPERVPAGSWYGISVGRSGLQDNFAFGWNESGHYVRTELYIDVRDKERNKAIFDALGAERETIEAEFGEPLEWDRNDDTQMCRIYARRAGSLDDPPENLEELQKWGAERLLRIRNVFGPRVRDLTAGRTPTPHPGP
jgi:Domain of unknown function (DUF4268)